MVMADDENPDFVANDSEQEVIREPPQIRSPDITLPDRKKFWVRPRMNTMAEEKVAFLDAGRASFREAFPDHALWWPLLDFRCCHF